jgi:hypothetical protein
MRSASIPRRTSPAAYLGGELDFMGYLGQWKLDPPLREADAVSINADSDDFESLRALAVPVPAPAPLASTAAGSSPMRAARYSRCRR